MREFKIGDWVMYNRELDDEYYQYGCIKGGDETSPYYISSVDYCGDICWESVENITLITPLRMRYLNYKGVQAWREIIPLGTHFKASPYHNEGKPTWIMEAFDLDKEAMRDFCMSDILEIG